MLQSYQKGGSYKPTLYKKPVNLSISVGPARPIIIPTMPRAILCRLGNLLQLCQKSRIYSQSLAWYLAHLNRRVVLLRLIDFMHPNLSVGMTEPASELTRKRLRTSETEDCTSFEPSEKRLCHYNQVRELLIKLVQLQMGDIFSQFQE